MSDVKDRQKYFYGKDGYRISKLEYYRQEYYGRGFRNGVIITVLVALAIMWFLL